MALTHKGEVYTFGNNDEGALGRSKEATAEFDADEIQATARPIVSLQLR